VTKGFMHRASRKGKEEQNEGRKGRRLDKRHHKAGEISRRFLVLWTSLLGEQWTHRKRQKIEGEVRRRSRRSRFKGRINNRGRKNEPNTCLDMYELWREGGDGHEEVRKIELANRLIKGPYKVISSKLLKRWRERKNLSTPKVHFNGVKFDRMKDLLRKILKS